MNREYIESGILELYVFGRLSDEENREVQAMAEKHDDVKAEIVAIEKAVINLSYSVAPYLSAENYEKIRRQLIEKHGETPVVDLQERQGNGMSYLGWAAAVILMFGLGFQYYKYNGVIQEKETVQAEQSKYKQLVAELQDNNTKNEHALTILRDKYNTAVNLDGQAAAPEAYAKVYINKQTNQVHVDISGLPKPPEGKAYQVWALKLNPLTPESIGVIEDTTVNKGIFTVKAYDGAEAFGITLEPAGGSPTPTMEQLYALGKV